MKNIFLTIKGFFIGIANIIPGVSGGTLMITLGVYEDIIEAISHFFKNFKKNINLLFFIGLGAIISILLMSRVVTFALDNYHLPTILFFIGLILGGVPMLFKKVRNKIKTSEILLFLTTFILILSITFIDGSMSEVTLTNMSILQYIILFLVGMLASSSMVIPGISGSFILIFLGYYEPIMNTIKDLTSFNNIFENFIVLSVLGLGVIIGIVLIAKLIEYLLKKFEIKTYSAILGFVTASAISILITAINTGVSFTILNIVLALILFIAGFLIAYKLGE